MQTPGPSDEDKTTAILSGTGARLLRLKSHASPRVRELVRRLLESRAGLASRRRAEALLALIDKDLPGRFGVPAEARPSIARVQARAEDMMSRHGFLGVPIETFARAGWRQLNALRAEGLHPRSVVLDIGCGCLRGAYWLIQFLDPGGYHGIEPNRVRVEHGLRYLLTLDETKDKRPRFDFNPHFDSSVFGARFDFFLAGSSWTHASKPDSETMLDAFVRDSTLEGVFLTSYLRARSAAEDYRGDRWSGTSHESSAPGVIRHSLAWITQRCGDRGLSVTERSGEAFDGQRWLRIRRAEARS